MVRVSHAHTDVLNPAAVDLGPEAEGEIPDPEIVRTLAARDGARLPPAAALERLWNRPITAEMLRSEALRIERSSRLPGGLAELYAALDQDAFVFEECVARATLSDRLLRSLFEGDSRRPTGLPRPGAEPLRP